MAMAIKDSGARTEFESGAVRDIQEGKGRCDLMPLGLIGDFLDCDVLRGIERFRETGVAHDLLDCLTAFQNELDDYNYDEEMFLDVAKHFEEGAKKYGENNWQKGIPVHSYIDSAVRHLLKHRMGMEDEPHGRAFIWNILCAVWTVENKPELDDFTVNAA